MKTDTAFVGAQSGIELHAEAAIDLLGARIVDPRHPEDDLPFGLEQPSDDGGVGVLGVLVDDWAQAGQNLVDGLVEFDLARVAASDFLVDVVQPLV